MKNRRLSRVFPVIGFLLFLPFQSFALCPEVQFNFDVNGTLIWDDPEGGKTIKDGIEAAYSKSKTLTKEWSAGSSSMTFDEYLKGTEKSEKKKMISAWIDTNFLRVEVDKALEDVKKTLNGKPEAETAIIFPSVFELLAELKKREIKFNITLRTFGTDGLRVSKSISSILASIIGSPVEFKFAEFIDEHTLKVHGEDKNVEGYSEIAKFFRSQQYLVVRDQYSRWGMPKNGDVREYWRNGKPFYFETSKRDSPTLPIFFDDNANSKDESSEEDIICPITDSGEKIHPFSFYNKQIFQVSTLDAGNQVHYYKDLVLPLLSTFPGCIK
jgi:hypothetical protein